MIFVDTVELRHIETWLKDGDAKVCKCKVTFGNNMWSISEWYTNSAYQHQGLGVKTLRHTLKKLYEMFGAPGEIRYIWNGDHEYVFNWLQNNFSPVSLLPISVQKYSDADDWSAHIYILDKAKVFKFFRLEEDEEE